MKEKGKLRKEYYNNGQLKIEYHTKNNKLNGPYTLYYSDGKLWTKCTYINNKRIGFFKYYSKSNNINILECIYFYKNGKKDYLKYDTILNNQKFVIII